MYNFTNIFTIYNYTTITIIQKFWKQCTISDCQQPIYTNTSTNLTPHKLQFKHNFRLPQHKLKKKNLQQWRLRTRADGRRFGPGRPWGVRLSDEWRLEQWGLKTSGVKLWAWAWGTEGFDGVTTLEDREREGLRALTVSVRDRGTKALNAWNREGPAALTSSPRLKRCATADRDARDPGRGRESPIRRGR